MVHKEFCLFLVCLSLLGTSHSQINFPETNLDLGYEYSEVHVRVAMPIDSVGRIWIKGSSKYKVAKLTDKDGNKTKEIRLKPPFYTDVVSTVLTEAVIEFCDNGNECIKSKKVFPVNNRATENKNFSVLLYGCLEPFQVVEKHDKAISTIFEGDNNSSLKMRELFSQVALHQNITFKDSINRNNEFLFTGIKDSTLLNNAPDLIITTGDQVYVDAGYKTKVRNGDHPISAWETKRRPHPFDTSQVKYLDFLNKLYNASYSFNHIEQAHSKLPTIATIDDHELRDGWGSQGDEYEKGKMNKDLEPFYNLGKKAFIEHQLKLSNYTFANNNSLAETTQSMHYDFNHNGINGFVFDLRSSRNINQESILGENQWKDFESWLTNLKDDQEIILVTSIPLTLRPLKFFENFLKLLKPELRDDVRDGWSYRKNIKDRDRLIKLLTEHRIKRNIKPIFVSGDVHKSALIEIWVDPYADRDGSHDIFETMILGYEIVASGLSHEFIKTGLSKSIFKITESQRIGDGFIEFDYNGYDASLYPMVRNSTVSQNFGAIEFSENEQTKLHTFVYNNDQNVLQQLFINLDFDKKLPDEDYYIIKNKNRPKAKRVFQPPIIHGMRVIKE